MNESIKGTAGESGVWEEELVSLKMLFAEVSIGPNCPLLQMPASNDHFYLFKEMTTQPLEDARPT